MKLRIGPPVTGEDFYYPSLLGNVLEQLGRYTEAEAAYRAAIQVGPNYAYAWGWLGALLTNHTSRILEAEQALRRAIQLDAEDPFFYARLEELLAKDPASVSEARSWIVKALQLKPGSEWYQMLFNELCAHASLDWQFVLPSLAAWCGTNPKNTEVFDFTIEGFLQYARLTKPADALALLQTLPDTSPFETLIDAFRAHADREHLNRLAPERQAVVIELLNRLSTTNRL